jgi:hypothetical protein
MIGIALLFIAPLIWVIGLWLLGKVEVRGIGIFSAMVGILTFLMAMNFQFQAKTMAEHFGVAQLLLFSFTYIWLAWNLLWDPAHESKTLGWYTVFVTIVAIPTGYLTGDVRLMIMWWSWGFVWFLFFLILAMGVQKITKFTAYACFVVSILTIGLPGFLILIEKW